MAVFEILQVGHPTLRERAEELSAEELATAQWQGFIDNLVETMRAANGAGLAANQVGVLRRICAVEVRAENPRYPEKEPIALTILVNPVITPLDASTMSSYEGCLSVPNIRGQVTRNAHIEIAYLDRDGNSQKRIAQGFQAVTYQHECDHLDGLLFLDRVTDPTTLTTWENFSDRLQAYFGFQFGYCPEVKFVQHHRAHVASAYYLSGFPSALALSIDRSGDGVSLAVYRCSGTDLELLHEEGFPNSIGLFAALMTQYLGFPLRLRRKSAAIGIFL